MVKRIITSVLAVVVALVVVSSVGAQSKGNGNSQNTHGSAVSAVAKSICTAVNHHPSLPANAASAAKTATAKPNHGQCVSAAAHQNRGQGKSKDNGQRAQNGKGKGKGKGSKPEPGETETPGD
jgi:hypothetical protein